MERVMKRPVALSPTVPGNSTVSQGYVTHRHFLPKPQLRQEGSLRIRLILTQEAGHQELQGEK